LGQKLDKIKGQGENKAIFEAVACRGTPKQ